MRSFWSLGWRRRLRQEVRIKNQRQERGNTKGDFSPVSLSGPVDEGLVLLNSVLVPSILLARSPKGHGQGQGHDSPFGVDAGSSPLLLLPSLSTEPAARRAVEHGNSMGWMDGLWFVIWSFLVFDS
jgi:hypothetical protein